MDGELALHIYRRLGINALWLRHVMASNVERNRQITESILGRHQIKMLTLDLDGTALNDQKKIVPGNVKAIRDFKNQNPERVVCIATGRGYYQALDFAKEINADYIITSHGGAIFEKRGDVYSLYKAFPIAEQKCATVYKAVAKCAEENPNIIWHLDTTDRQNCFVIQKGEDALQKANNTFYPSEKLDRGVVEIADYKNLKKKGLINKTLKICLEFGENKLGRSQCRQFAEYLKQKDIEFECIGDSKLEIIHSGINKGTSILEISRKKGIKNGEIAAIGNGSNDLSMYKEVRGIIGWGIGNADKVVSTTVPLLKKTNNEPFVPELLERSNLYSFFKEEHAVTNYPGGVCGQRCRSLNEHIVNAQALKTTSIKNYAEQITASDNNPVRKTQSAHKDSRIM